MIIRGTLARLALLVALPMAGLSAQDLQQTGSNLPIVIIDTDTGAQPPDNPKVGADMTVVYRGPGQRTYPSDASNPAWVDNQGRIGIEARGSSSQSFPKKQWGLETRMPDNSTARNDPMLGMPAENDWILSAPYSDKSLMRNYFAYEMARRMGWWAPRTVFVEVVLNGSYHGVYLMMERVKRDKNRVDIEALTSADISGDALTGGYIFKIDRPDRETGVNSWVSPWQNNIRWQNHDPKDDEMLQVQKDYIRNWVTDFESLFYNGGYDDPQTGYRAHADVASFVDMFLMRELGKDVDAYILSAYFQKDRDSKGGKIVSTPIWDMNLAYGNANYRDGWITSGWQITPGIGSTPQWEQTLWGHGPFQADLSRRWDDLRSGTLSLTEVHGFIDETAAYLSEAAGRNFQRWPVLGIYVWPNADGYESRTTYQSEVNYFKTWFTQRMAWMDSNIAPGVPCSAELVISEVNYNSAVGNNGGDWVEIYNPGNSAVNLFNWSFSDQVGTFNLPSAVIPAKGYRVLVENVTEFTQLYRNVSNYTGSLISAGITFDNGRERLSLADPSGCTADEVRYDDASPWPTEADGNGYSLELINLASDNLTYENWQRSGPVGGTPGAANSSGPEANPCAVTPADILINEIMYAPQTATSGDWVELLNNSGSSVDMSGWHFRDSDDGNVYRIPDGTSIVSGGFLVLAEELPQFQATYPSVSNVEGSFNFGLKSSGETLRLYSAPGCLADQVAYTSSAPWPTGAIDTGFTIGWVDGDNAAGANWQLSEESGGTPGVDNWHVLPQLNLTSPADGATFDQNDAITFIVQNQNPGGTPLAAVRLYVNDVFSATLPRYGQTQSYIKTIPFAIPGVYEIKAIGTDDEGFVGVSNIRTIEVLPVFVDATIKLNLSGPWLDGQMTSLLGDKVPLSPPYNTDVNVTKTRAWMDARPEIVDWIWLQLRTTVSGAPVRTIPAFVTESGAVMSVDGTSTMRFDGVSSGSYYLIAGHRSHLSVISPVRVSF